MEERYKYLFPFELIPKGSRIVIYGVGVVGQEYYRQIRLTHYCEVVCFVDKDWAKYQGTELPIYSYEKMHELEFDYIILAFRSAVNSHNVTVNLKEMGIMEDKIICGFLRDEIGESDPVVTRETDSIETFAFKKSKYAIAMKFANALGDTIVAKKFFEAICRLAPDALIDIYSMLPKETMQALFAFESNVNQIIYDNDTLYNQNSRKYMLAITAPYFPQIDYVSYEVLNDYNAVLSKKIQELQNLYKDLTGNGNPVRSRYMYIWRQYYKGKNFRTSYQCDGIFDVDDSPAILKLNHAWQEYFDNLQLNRYITINYGTGLSAKYSKQKDAKQWPYDRYVELVGKIHAQYPELLVVQIGVKGAEEIIGCDRYFLGENLEVVKYLLKYALIHVDVESGLVHLAAALGTKCVVLVGPTNGGSFYLYDNNINIRAGNCHGCMGLYPSRVCVRGLNEPECMYSITPEMVMGSVEKYLKAVCIY